MSHYKPYRAYKDSGVEWLGKVPAHWGVLRLKWELLFLTSGSRGWADHYADDGALFIRIGNLTRDSTRLDLSDVQRVVVPRGAEGERTIVFPGDLLFSITAFLGSVAVVPNHLETAYVSQHVALARLFGHVLNAEWVGYVALSWIGKTYLESQGYGGTKVQLSLDDIANLVMVAPPMDEQLYIVDVIERETARIDELVSRKTRFIELLREKRQALITHAVTKGLDPNAPMKDSGVEWLGDVPAHWSVGLVKHWHSTTSGGTPDTSRHDLFYTDEGGYPWIRTTDLDNDRLSTYEVAITDAALRSSVCVMLPVGTVLLAMYGGGGTVGKNALLNISACINQALCALLPTEHFLNEYTFRYIQFYKPYWMIDAESSRKDPNISQELVRNAPMLKPPLSEQQSIVNYLDRENDRIDTLISTTESSIELLKERRSALITAAVTGQIDLREDA